METDQVGRLRDILEAARLISSYVKDAREADFHANKEKQDAVIRRIEIIGEAAAHLTEATRRAVPELDFRKMRGMRNIVAHDYANVDLHIIWEVAIVYVPEICAVLEKLFAGQE
ncbi:MAG TPA: DUF86 domain-containing protein [Candidatus Binatia bacterium]|nr:DUF86 domain-containing protein [Candidatus Binatia bacterium]